MKIRLLILIVFGPIFLFAQVQHSVSGYITNSKTGERLIGATAYNRSTGQGTISNNFGFFSISTNKDVCNIEFRYVGYKSQFYSFELKNDTFLNIQLTKGIDIEEIQVTTQSKIHNNPELSGLSQPRLSMQIIESTPVIFGERDIIKTLQFLPGIKQGAESTSNFNVRGGSGDQNLILLDGVPVYNANHLLGFFSVFNTDAIKNVNLIKGGIPARYGGRLSSILDISMKEGNMKEDSGTFSISPVSGRFTYESPIKKDTAAFILSFRRTFFDIPMVAIQKLSGENGNYGYMFYDFNAKTNWILNKKNRLYLSFYSGKDKQFANTKENKDSKSAYRYKWGNVTSVMRWNKVYSSKLFSNTLIYYSKFNHTELGKAKDNNTKTLFNTSSELHDISLQSNFEYYINPRFIVRFGVNFSHLIFTPNIIQIKDIYSERSFNNQNKTTANESSAYIENAMHFGKLKLNIGARFSSYFTENKNYNDFQPRCSSSLQLAPRFSINTSYTKMTQNIHLLSNSSLGMPTDLWVASTRKIGPQYAQQATFGFSKRIDKYFIFEVEAYYKWMKNVVRFDEGVAFTNPKKSSWDDNVLTGTGRAYGTEFLLQKEKGKLTGWVSYTLSWSERKYTELNKGNWYPFKYDRRHDVSALLSYALKEKYNKNRMISVGFTLQSGNNLSIANTEYEGLLTPGRDYSTHNNPWEKIRQTYDNPNNYKMPTFHHLDIGYNVIKEKNDNKSITWSFSVYNAYNRMNPWYYYKDGNKVKQVSMFPIIPSVGFKYIF